MTTYRRDIDGLRAVAVLSVLAFHTDPNLMPGGFIGVDIFFVISGYLISGILFYSFDTGTFSYAEFYSRRIKRIFPALITVLVTCAVAGWFLLQPADYETLGKEIVAGGAFVANLAFWREAGYFDAAAQTKPLLHLWSLGVEEQYYLIWPIVLGLVWRYKISFLKTTTTLAIASFAINIATLYSHPSAAFYSPLSRLWELILGSVLAYAIVHRQRQVKLLQESRSLVGAILIAVAAFFLTKDTAFPGWAALLPTLGAFLLISSPGSRINRFILENSALRYIGLISYPLYLWHWPLLFAVQYLGMWSEHGPWVARGIAIALSFALSIATNQAIEKPIRFGRYRRYLVIPTAGAMIVLVGTGALITRYNGFSYRETNMVAALAKLAHENLAAQWREHTCFMEPEDGGVRFSSECASDPEKPSIFLWGDSFAAALYPGLRELQEAGKAGIAQYTSSACPPMLNVPFPTRPFCQSTNDSIAKTIARLKPSTVLLAADWRLYGATPMQDTVAFLKDVGIKHVVLVGSPPYWTHSLPLAVHNCLPSASVFGKNLYTWCGLDPANQTSDQAIRQLAHSLSVDYVSALNAMCNTNGCLMVIDNHDLSSYDLGHLSPSASRFLVRLIEPQIMPN